MTFLHGIIGFSKTNAGYQETFLIYLPAEPPTPAEG